MLISIIIFLTAIIATALSSASGGGASVINIPVLLWLGVPFPLAMAAQKLSSTFWVLPAAYNYLRGRKVNWVFLIAFTAFGLIGAYMGVIVILRINQRIMEMVIGILILLLALYTYLKKDIGLQKQRVYSRPRQSLAYVFAPILGFYESIFGSGNGILFSLASFYTRGFDFVDALGYYFAVAFPWVLFAALFLISKGYASVSVMIPIVTGSLIGGYIGSKFARFKGNRFIKLMFVTMGSILGLKLIFGI